MDKKAWIGAVLLIIILIIVAVIVITFFQGYDLYKTVMSEKTNLDNNIAELQKGNCTKLPEVEASLAKIEAKATSACKNPILSMAVSSINNIPLRCKDMSDLKAQAEANLAQVKEICANNTRISSLA